MNLQQRVKKLEGEYVAGTPCDACEASSAFVDDQGQRSVGTRAGCVNGYKSFGSTAV